MNPFGRVHKNHGLIIFSTMSVMVVITNDDDKDFSFRCCQKASPSHPTATRTRQKDERSSDYRYSIKLNHINFVE